MADTAADEDVVRGEVPAPAPAIAPVAASAPDSYEPADPKYEPAVPAEADGGDVPSVASKADPLAVPQSVIDTQKEKVRAEDRIYGDMFGLARSDADYAKRILDAEGIDPKDVQPWNADAERKKYETDPIQSFGSIGSVFAIVASTFTRQPMLNALNGSAAAMEAIKTGNEREYARAYQAWKDNTALAIKRSEMMHHQYQDAMDMMKTNMVLGEAKARAVASRFGDQQVLNLMQAGMWDKVFELQSAREDATKKIRDNQRGAQDQSLDDMDLNLRVRRALGGLPDPIKQHVAQAMARGDVAAAIKAIPPEFQTKFIKEIEEWRESRKPGGANAHQRELDRAERAREFDIRQQGEEENRIERARHNRAIEGARTTGGNTALTRQRQIARDTEAYKTEIEAEKNPDGSPKYTPAQIRDMTAKESARLTAESTPVPPGKSVDLKLQINHLQRASDKIDTLEKMMVQHGMITGLGGKIRRPAETVVDILGGDATAAKEFQANLVELQQWVARLIDNKINAGRPLSVAELRMQDIVPGLKLGDTTIFVERQLRTLQRDLKRMQQEDQEILDKGPRASGGSGKPPPSGGDVPAWQRLGVPGGE